MIFKKIKEDVLYKILIGWVIVGVTLLYFMPKEYSQIFIIRLILVFPISIVLLPFTLFIIPLIYFIKNMLHIFFSNFLVNSIISILLIYVFYICCKEEQLTFASITIHSLFFLLEFDNNDVSTDVSTEKLKIELERDKLLELSDMLCAGARIIFSNGLVLETVKWNGNLYIDILGLEPQQQIKIIEEDEDGFLIDIYGKEHFLLFLEFNTDFEPLFEEPAFCETTIQYILNLSNIVNIYKTNIVNLGKKEITPYESYIKYLYKRKGYRVKYLSSRSFLICYKGSKTLIIYCKKCDSTIHEKYIYQISKFIFDYSMSITRILNSEHVSGIFYTTSYFSDNAKKIATIQNIRLVENFQMYKDKK